jgi:hypothetical protein
MSSKKTFILLDHSLEPSSVDGIIGRFVSDPGNPDAGFAPGNLSVLKEELERKPTTSTTSEERYKATVKSITNVNWLLELLSLLGIKGGSSNVSSITLSGYNATTHRIQQFRGVFEALIENERIKKDLLRLLDDNRGVAYFATGTLILTNGSVEVVDKSGHSASASFSIPSSLSPQETTTEAGKDSSRMESTTYAWEGPRLCAVQYYKVFKPSYADDKTHIEPRPSSEPHAVYGNDIEVRAWNPREDDLDDVELLSFDTAGGAGAGVLEDSSY